MVHLLWQDLASFGLQHLNRKLLNIGYSSTLLAVYIVTALLHSYAV